MKTRPMEWNDRSNRSDCIFLLLPCPDRCKDSFQFGKDKLVSEVVACLYSYSISEMHHSHIYSHIYSHFMYYFCIKPVKFFPFKGLASVFFQIHTYIYIYLYLLLLLLLFSWMEIGLKFYWMEFRQINILGFLIFQTRTGHCKWCPLALQVLCITGSRRCIWK